MVNEVVLWCTGAMMLSIGVLGYVLWTAHGIRKKWRELEAFVVRVLVEMNVLDNAISNLLRTEKDAHSN